MINIVFAGGGTGGHIYPGLAVVAELRKKLESNGITKEKYSVIWIGSKNGMDKDIVEKDGSVDKFIGIGCCCGHQPRENRGIRRYAYLRRAVRCRRSCAAC